MVFDEFYSVVQPDWIDENDHLNMGYYVVVFDKATDAFLDHIGLTAEFKEAHRVTTFTLESHVNYLRELGLAPLRFTTRLIAYDAKRIHYFHEMYHGEEAYLAATNELISLHVSQETRRAAAMAPEIQARLAAVQEQHAPLPMPLQVGRRIGLDSNRA